MKSLLKQIFIFSVPLGLLFAFPALVAWKSGEIMPLASVIKAQRDHSRLMIYAPLFRSNDRDFKRASILARRPEVLALGTSRVQEFRSAMFKPGVNFYNGSFAATGIRDMTDFIHQLPNDYKPNVLIVSLDQYNFFSDRQKIVDGFTTKDPHTALENLIRGGWRQVYAHVLSGKISTAVLADMFYGSDPTYVGLQAMVDKLGFRNDGSVRFASFIDSESTRAAMRRGADADIEKIAPDAWGFVYGKFIEPEAIADLKDLLMAARGRNIHVIGFLPPIYHGLYAKIASMNDAFHGSMVELPMAVDRVFRSYDHDFYDFTDITSYGSSDTEMFDELHGTETNYLRFLLVMARQNTTLAPYIDVPAMEEKLRSASPDDYELFGREL